MTIRQFISARAQRAARSILLSTEITPRTGSLLPLVLLAVFAMLPAGLRAQNTSLQQEGSASIDRQIQAGGYVIPPSYFGMHINNVNTPWPNAFFSGLRLEGSDVNWWNIEEAPGVYDYFWLDQWLLNAQQNNVSVIYTFVGVPQFYSSIPTDTRCTFNLGACDPPYDVNEDGSGTDAAFINFVTDLAMHNAELGNPIQYWEMWNEPDIPKQWIPTCENPGNTCTGNLKYAQLLRMAKDGAAVIKSFNPKAVILSPAPVGLAGGLAARWLGEYLAALKQEKDPYPDVIAFHGYLNQWIMGFFPTPEKELTLVGEMKQSVKKVGMENLPLWVTEGSWGNTLLDGYTNSYIQASFLARYLVSQQSTGVARGYWYQWDHPTGDGTLWKGPGSSGDWELAGFAYNSVVNWTIGAILTSPCSNQQGTTVWVCQYSRLFPPGYQAQIVWNSLTDSSYTVPQGFKQYCDLKGTMVPIIGQPQESVTIGPWPILLENKNLLKGPCQQI